MQPLNTTQKAAPKKSQADIEPSVRVRFSLFVSLCTQLVVPECTYSLYEG